MKVEYGTGGGEILQYIGKSPDSENWYQTLNKDAMRQLAMIPYVKGIIICLAIVLATIVIFKIFSIRSITHGKAINNELKYLSAVKKKEDQVLQANKFMKSTTSIVEHTNLRLAKSYVDYWTYNLERANIRIPGGSRVMTAQEFNALIRFFEAVIAIASILILIFLNAPAGFLLLIMDILFSNTLPMMFIRASVKDKDSEIVRNFADFYLMLHYVLLTSASTPLSGVIKSYDKTTESTEMHRFVDCCIHYIDTYGEYDATKYISRQYREVPQVTKLMRLIRQANEGGDIREELIGFRNQLLEARAAEMEKKMNKMVAKAQRSFSFTLTPVLFQAIISAMMVYIGDLGMVKGLLNT